ncbi:MAG: hypothetical protein LBF94_02680 [Puniceicoccales bacterium]|jgi:hypothetical protein|nr:hypothetical protein [Puniceicoccales bacterium]
MVKTALSTLGGGVLGLFTIDCLLNKDTPADGDTSAAKCLPHSGILETISTRLKAKTIEAAKAIYTVACDHSCTATRIAAGCALLGVVIYCIHKITSSPKVQLTAMLTEGEDGVNVLVI